MECFQTGQLGRTIVVRLNLGDVLYGFQMKIDLDSKIFRARYGK